jgi:hypothetical protein
VRGARIYGRCLSPSVNCCRNNAAAVQRVFITFADVDRGSTRHQCVFLRCNRERQLMQANAAAVKAYGYQSAPPYTPHLSLLYSDTSADERCAG